MRHAALIFFFIGMLVSEASASGLGGRSSRIQWEPDLTHRGVGRGVLIDKDVGFDRWSIRFGIEGDTEGIATGIVSNLDYPNRDPLFVYCILGDIEGDGVVPERTTFVFDCGIADSCGRGPCGEEAWHDIGIHRIPASFFIP
jgi:hypothetical protein